MSLVDLIKMHCLSDAQAGNWSAVAATLNAQTITLEGLRISGKQTILGLLSLGRDPDAIRLVLEATPSGRGLLDLLPGVGVNWVDPLTLAVLARNTGAGNLSTEDVNALKSLSFRRVSLAQQSGLETVSGDDCQSAWTADLARQALETIRTRRQTWDTVSAEIRSGIESGSLTHNADVIAAVTTKLGV
jgi:hypothetical protein